MNEGRPLQEPFLNALRLEGVPVSIFLINGIKLQGTIESFDRFAVLLKNSVSQMIYKHAISSIVPVRNVRLPKTPRRRRHRPHRHALVRPSAPWPGGGSRRRMKGGVADLFERPSAGPARCSCTRGFAGRTPNAPRRSSSSWSAQPGRTRRSWSSPPAPARSAVLRGGRQGGGASGAGGDGRNRARHLQPPSDAGPGAESRGAAQVPGARPDRSHPRHIRAACEHLRRPAAGGARAASPPVDPARSRVDPSRAPARRDRPARPWRDAARDRPAPRRQAHRADRAAARRRRAPARGQPPPPPAHRGAGGLARRLHERRQVHPLQPPDGSRSACGRPALRDPRPDPAADAAAGRKLPGAGGHRRVRGRSPPRAGGRLSRHPRGDPAGGPAAAT